MPFGGTTSVDRDVTDAYTKYAVNSGIIMIGSKTQISLPHFVCP